MAVVSVPVDTSQLGKREDITIEAAREITYSTDWLPLLLGSHD